MHIRFQIAMNVYLMFKNKIFMRAFTQDPIEAHMTLNPLYQVLHETCQSEQATTEQDANQTANNELYTECVNILSLCMCLNNGKYHIPGETVENLRLKQRAIDSGVLVFVVYVLIETKNESLKKYIKEEFFEKVDESDFEYHFKKNHSHYAMVGDFVNSAKSR